jgi:hypothetical protein
MNLFDTWKKGFDAWERATAGAFDELLRNRAVLGPAGAALSAAMRVKAAGDRAAARWWGSWGLSTKRDQERTLHKLNQLESRLLDLTERLEDR